MVHFPEANQTLSDFLTVSLPYTLSLLGAGYGSLGIMDKIPGRKKIVSRVRSSNRGSTNAGGAPLRQCSPRLRGARERLPTVCQNVLQKLTQPPPYSPNAPPYSPNPSPPTQTPPHSPLTNEVLVFGLERVRCGVLRD